MRVSVVLFFLCTLVLFFRPQKTIAQENTLIDSLKLVIKNTKDDSVKIIKGDLRSIGRWVRKRSRLPEFNIITISLKRVSVLYLATDGLEDLLGGKDFKKFGRKTFVELIKI